MAQKVKSGDVILDELVTIKKLLVLKLLSEGINQTQIGSVLGIDRTQISRMVPASILKPARSKNKK